MYSDDEATEFELRPLGARQRLLPSRTFLSRIPAQVPASLQAPPMVDAPATPVSLAEGTPVSFHTPVMAEIAAPIHLQPPVAIERPLPMHAPVTPVAARRPSLPPVANPVMLLPPEIHYPDELVSSTFAALSTSASSSGMAAVLPIASRRFRWLAVPVVSLLALIVLGGAMWNPHEPQAPSIAPGIMSTVEDIRPGADLVTASEDPAPEEAEPEIEIKPTQRVAKRVVKRAVARTLVAKVKPAKRVGKRAVTVNTSSALGHLRPKKAW